MPRERAYISCPGCGERFRSKALRCPSCGVANPLRERLSLEERVGPGGIMILLALVGVVLLLLGGWLTYEVLALGRLNPYLVAAAGLLIVVGVGSALAQRWRK